MINLLPPEIKKQIKFAKMNRLGLRYLKITVAMVVVLAVIFGGALYMLKQQTDEKAKDVAEKQARIAAASKDFLPKAKDASERLNAIKYVQDTQTKYSVLVADLSKALPKDVFIEDVRLTGDEKAPMTMRASAKKYDQILALRNSLAESPRISAADIVTINGENNIWTGTIVVGFKPGQAK